MRESGNIHRDVNMSNELVKVIGGKSIRARDGDHYVNATELCKAAGKRWGNYWQNTTTQEFIQALVESTGIPVEELVEMKSGFHGGTWIHPRVAIHCAQWASAEFAAAVTGWVLELITTGRVELSGATAIEPLDPDPIIDGLMRHQQAFKMTIETRRRQVEVERAQADMVKTLAQMVLTMSQVNNTANAALHQATSNHGYFTVLGYSRLHGREMPVSQAAAHGRRLTAICAARGITVHRMTDPRFGEVNTYPESVLREHFGDDV